MSKHTEHGCSLLHSELRLPGSRMQESAGLKHVSGKGFFLPVGRHLPLITGSLVSE